MIGCGFFLNRKKKVPKNYSFFFLLVPREGKQAGMTSPDIILAKKTAHRVADLATGYGLYVGGGDADPTPYSLIINVARGLIPVRPKSTVQFPWADNPEQPILHDLQTICPLIDVAQGSVLVQCKQGISRSVTVAIAYLVYKGWTLKEGHAQVVTSRPGANRPHNVGFWRQLESWEAEHRVEKT